MHVRVAKQVMVSYDTVAYTRLSPMHMHMYSILEASCHKPTSPGTGVGTTCHAQRRRNYTPIRQSLINMRTVKAK